MQKKNFNLNNKLYPEIVIHKAIEDFGSDFSIVYENEMVTISWENPEEIQIIFDEFMNYVLSLISEQL